MSERELLDQRRGDPGRPELTPERICELLRLVPQIYERDRAIGKFLFRPALPDESGKSARRLLGKQLASVVAEMAGDVHAFVRDVFWLQLIALNLRGGESIDERLRIANAFSDADVWGPLRPKRREQIAEQVTGVAALLKRVGRQEEAAVRAAIDEVLGLYFRYRQVR